MKTMTAKNLKNKTGAAMRAVSKGEKIEVSLRPFKEAWSNIEDALKKTRPRFKNVREAMAWTRRR